MPASCATKSFYDPIHSKIVGATFTERAGNASNFIEDSKNIKDICHHLKISFPATDFSSMHLSGKELTSTLNDFINQDSIDLVTMISHKRPNIPEVLSNSKTRRIVIRSNVPLLAIPAGSKHQQPETPDSNLKQI